MNKIESLRKTEIDKLTKQLNTMLPNILEKYHFDSVHSLNAKIGGKHAQYFDIKNDVIVSPDQFVAKYFDGMVNYIKENNIAFSGNAYFDFQQLIANNQDILDYAVLFLKRTYWRNYNALSKVRPKDEEAELWIGQENAVYGLLITPRFKNGNWENDKSEIRHFKKDYWTIEHVLETGLLILYKNEKISFDRISDYLNFFKNVIVRNSGSKYEMQIAEKYCEFVWNAKNPYKVPLLIPELRYEGLEKKHKYRLDFTIINPYSMEKYGFELSPWSTHGYIKSTKHKTQIDINKEALNNFEKEIEKQKSYFNKFKIYTIIYSDTDLQNIDKIFDQISVYLSPEKIYINLLNDSIINLKNSF